MDKGHRSRAFAGRYQRVLGGVGIRVVHRVGLDGSLCLDAPNGFDDGAATTGAIASVPREVVARGAGYAADFVLVDATATTTNAADLVGGFRRGGGLLVVGIVVQSLPADAAKNGFRRQRRRAHRRRQSVVVHSHQLHVSGRGEFDPRAQTKRRNGLVRFRRQGAGIVLEFVVSVSVLVFVVLVFPVFFFFLLLLFAAVGILVVAHR
mmetsp:Transcript_26324/g.72357  ORF Transcript_26324/g.72357 Transcript_26324/m.72357 type:complete len:207 (+) Transcript_26324:1313-1933(+)